MSSTANGTLTISEARLVAAAALSPQSDDDPSLLAEWQDSVEPPAIMLFWDDPWLEPRGQIACWWMANLTILCVAGRLEPGAGMEVLEALVGYTANRLDGAPYSFGPITATAPRSFAIGGIDYLAASLSLQVPVTTQEGDFPWLTQSR